MTTTYETKHNERGQLKYNPKSQKTTIMWEINDFFSFPDQQENYWITSPSFSLLNGNWHLGICSIGNMHASKHTDLWLSLYSFQIHNVAYKLGIRGKDGTELMIIEGLFKFGKDINTMIFTRVPHLFCCNRKLFAPSDELTVFCTLRKVSGATKVQVGSTGITAKNSKECDSRQTKSSTLSGVERLVQDIKGLFLNEQDTDVMLKVEEQEFLAHRAILKARSPVFRAMLENDMNEKRSSIIEIGDCDSGAFRHFLFYLYSGKVELSSTNVLNLYKAADMYDIADLKAECSHFIKSNMRVDTFCGVMELALRHNESEMLKIATEFFAKNLDTITISVDWQNFLKMNPVAANEIYIKALKYHGVLK